MRNDNIQNNDYTRNILNKIKAILYFIWIYFNASDNEVQANQSQLTEEGNANNIELQTQQSATPPILESKQSALPNGLFACSDQTSDADEDIKLHAQLIFKYMFKVMRKRGSYNYSEQVQNMPFEMAQYAITKALEEHGALNDEQKGRLRIKVLEEVRKHREFHDINIKIITHAFNNHEAYKERVPTLLFADLPPLPRENESVMSAASTSGPTGP